MIDVRFRAANLDRRLSARGRERRFPTELPSATMVAS